MASTSARPYGKALGRLKATIEKATKSTNGGNGKGGGKKGGGNGNKQPQPQQPPPDSASDVAPAPAPSQAPLTVRLLEDGASGEAVEVDLECLNVDAWRDGRVLDIGGVGQYRVRVNAPKVESVAAVGHSMVGYPLVGCAAGTQFCGGVVQVETSVETA